MPNGFSAHGGELLVGSLLMRGVPSGASAHEGSM